MEGTSVTLAYPKLNEDFIVETDASIKTWIRSRLVSGPGSTFDLVCYSRAFSPSKKNYGFTDLWTLQLYGHFPNLRPIPVWSEGQSANRPHCCQVSPLESQCQWKAWPMVD